MSTTTTSSTGTATTTIDAPTDVVYDLITDVARMGEWSPECEGADVPAGTHLRVGDTFTGRNARGDGRWTTRCVVIAADPSRLFAFTSGEPDVATTWTYELRDIGAGRTQIVESFDSLALRHPDLAAQLDGRHAQLLDDLSATLQALKQAAERETAP